MKHQLTTLAAILVGLLLASLFTISSLTLLLATPLLLYLVGSLIQTPRVSVSVSRSLSARRVTPDQPVTVSVTVTNRGGELTECRIVDSVPAGLTVVDGSAEARIYLAEGATHQYSYVVSGNRGSYSFRRIDVSGAGSLALRAQTQTHDIEDELVTLPNSQALSRIPIAPRRTLVYAGSLPARTGGEGTEFFDVREHSEGDSLRHINWRLSARDPNRLYVNEFQQERVADIAVMLDCRIRAYSRTSGRSLFDYAADAAASFADVILDAGNRVGYLGYGTSLDWLPPGFGKIQKQRLLTRIAHAFAGDSAVFHKLDALPANLFPPGSQLIVVSPLLPRDYEALERLVAHGYSVLVVSPAYPFGSAAPAADRRKNWFVRGRSGSEVATDWATTAAIRLARAERAVTLQRLRHSGIGVVDWVTDEPLEAALARSIGSIREIWRRRNR